MGNEQNKPIHPIMQPFVKGKITVDLNKQAYTSGEDISGVVCLQFLQEFDTNSLKLTLVGKEKTLIAPLNIKDFSTYQKTFHAETRPLIKQELEIKPPQHSRFVPGIYSYPFCFQTLKELPSSFRYYGFSDKKQLLCAIKYKIKATLINQQRTYFLKASKPIQMETIQFIPEASSSKSTTFYFTDSKSPNPKFVTLELNVSSSNWQIGDDCLAKISINALTSKVSPRNVQIKLIQCVNAIFGDQQFQSQKEIWKQILRQKLPKQVIYTDTQAIQSLIPAIVIKDLSPTTISRLINNQYYIQAQFQLDDKEIQKDFKNLVYVQVYMQIVKPLTNIVVRNKSVSKQVYSDQNINTKNERKLSTRYIENVPSSPFGQRQMGQTQDDFFLRELQYQQQINVQQQQQQQQQQPQQTQSGQNQQYIQEMKANTVQEYYQQTQQKEFNINDYQIPSEVQSKPPLPYVSTDQTDLQLKDQREMGISLGSTQSNSGFQKSQGM